MSNCTVSVDCHTQKKEEEKKLFLLCLKAPPFFPLLSCQRHCIKKCTLEGTAAA